MKCILLCIILGVISSGWSKGGELFYSPPPLDLGGCLKHPTNIQIDY